jgi:hypothetical protein
MAASDNAAPRNPLKGADVPRVQVKVTDSMIESARAQVAISNLLGVSVPKVVAKIAQVR